MPRESLKTYSDHETLEKISFKPERKDILRGYKEPSLYTNLWTIISLTHRRKNPECVRCLFEERDYTLGCDADHIIPLSEGGKKYHRQNIQTLCRKHHRDKTLEDVAWRDWCDVYCQDVRCDRQHALAVYLDLPNIKGTPWAQARQEATQAGMQCNQAPSPKP